MIDQLVHTDSERQAQAMPWKEVVAKYQEPAVGRSVWQIVNTLVPYVGLWVLMYFSLSVSYWLVVPLAILTSGFLVRIFIIFHDCGHGSYFKSRKVNDAVGFITGVLTWTPYFQWRWEHAVHHASSGDLDRRGMGDVWTLTVQEYLESSRWKKFAYRLARNPFILFVLAPTYLFLIHQRIPRSGASKRERHSVYWTNLALLGMAVAMSAVFGWKAYLIIQVSVTAFAGSVGVWLFYVQHQFEGAAWAREGQWNRDEAALAGSSHYDLPQPFRWLTGNIGIHHVHHLSSRIPFYRLPKVLKDHPELNAMSRLGFWESFRCARLALWDEAAGRLVSFREARRAV